MAGNGWTVPRPSFFVESLQDLRLYVNKNAAAAMGVEIPAAVLERADEVFE